MKIPHATSLALAAAVAGVALAGCSDSSRDSEPGEAQPSPNASAWANEAVVTESGKRLITWPENEGAAGMEALVSGQLRLSERGCFTLDGTVLAAPPGSTATDNSIRLPGLGQFRIGDRVEGTGGVLTDAGPLNYTADCVSQGEDLIVLSAESSG